MVRRSIMWVVVAVVLTMGAAADGAVETEYDLDSLPAFGVNPLTGTPDYVWWYGCSPTAGGMMVGYWDAKPGYENLFEGDASSWWGETNPAIGITGTRSMVAGTAHVVAGSENGYAYGDWRNSTSYPAHEANPDSLADFMQTVDSATYADGIRKGLEDYVEWDNPNTVTDESGPDPLHQFDALVELDDVPYFGGSYDYDDFKAEIDAGRPVILDLLTYYWGWAGHNVVGYGYQDDMFEIEQPAPGPNNFITVGGIAVRDTWDNGGGPGAQADWRDWHGAKVYPYVDADGVEWWPFVDFLGSSFFDFFNPHKQYWDWMIVGGISMDVQTRFIPEPGSIVIWSLLGGICVFAAWRRRRAA